MTLWTHAHRQDGFSLIEVLVVVLIVGLLAGIALTTLLPQQAKGQDADAKSNARNVAGAVETCNVEERDYRQCTAAAQLRDAGVKFGSAAGEVEVDASASTAYTVTAHSRSGTTFTFARASSGGLSRGCSRSGQGGCRSDGHW